MAVTTDLMKLVDIQVPSVDRPFGLHLWPVFNLAFERVVGFSTEEFRFEREVTPASILKESISLIALYYAVIFGGRAVMIKLSPIILSTLFHIFNLFRMAMSAALLVLIME